MILCDGRIDMRLGRWQDVLDDVGAYDAVICDPPYSERVHRGALSATGEVGVSGYAPWDGGDIAEFCGRASSCRGWVVVHCDDETSITVRMHMEARGRYGFAAVPVLQHLPRLCGDGPGSPGHSLSVSRPREARFMSWGSLPCWYEAPREAATIVRGAKPIGLMRAIVRDYTRPGDVVVDPFCGGGTTALACAIEGRRCITSEMDPVTYEKAVVRLSRGFTPNLFGNTDV